MKPPEGHHIYKSKNHLASPFSLEPLAAPTSRDFDLCQDAGRPWDINGKVAVSALLTTEGDVNVCRAHLGNHQSRHNMAPCLPKGPMVSGSVRDCD